MPSVMASFQSTRPLRGATWDGPSASTWATISIHAPLAGRDASFAHWSFGTNHFNPRAPCGARRLSRLSRVLVQYFNPRAPCGARPVIRVACGVPACISIHAPLAGRDKVYEWLAPPDLYFNPRAPCGARPFPQCSYSWIPKFQSTRPLRGATCPGCLPHAPPNISIHAPLAGRDPPGQNTPDAAAISIHAPLAGRDLIKERFKIPRSNFNPRAPCGARPQPIRPEGFPFNISIHAPLAGRDTTSPFMLSPPFSFQSTRPLRGATPVCRSRPPAFIYFNPRAPCGARRGAKMDLEDNQYFNPRAPCGARPRLSCSPEAWITFQSTRPLRGATKIHWAKLCHLWISIHAPLAGRDRLAISSVASAAHFNPRAPCGARREYGYVCARRY